MKNSVFKRRINELLARIHSSRHPDDKPLQKLSKSQVLKMLTTLLEPKKESDYIPSIAQRSYGPTFYDFPIIPEDYLLKEVSVGKTADFEFSAVWKVKHHDRTIGNISFSINPGCQGVCSYGHAATDAAGTTLTLQSALNELMAVDDQWVKTDFSFDLPKGFKAIRVKASDVQQYLITRRGHSVGEIKYQCGDEVRKSWPEGFMWVSYKFDDCDDGYSDPQDAVDRLIENYLSHMKERK